MTHPMNQKAVVLNPILKVWWVAVYEKANCHRMMTGLQMSMISHGSGTKSASQPWQVGFLDSSLKIPSRDYTIYTCLWGKSNSHALLCMCVWRNFCKVNVSHLNLYLLQKYETALFVWYFSQPVVNHLSNLFHKSKSSDSPAPSPFLHFNGWDVDSVYCWVSLWWGSCFAGSWNCGAILKGMVWWSVGGEAGRKEVWLWDWTRKKPESNDYWVVSVHLS